MAVTVTKLNASQQIDKIATNKALYASDNGAIALPLRSKSQRIPTKLRVFASVAMDEFA